MPVYSCSNCHFRFESAEKKNCPRCSSAEVTEFKQTRSERDGHAVVREEKPVVAGERPPGHVPFHYAEGKEGWKSFHAQQTNVCPHCGGVEFDLDWGKKEKTCRKCGEILPLQRRFA